MKLNFSILIFLLIITIPFFLLKSENTKTDKLEFIELESNLVERDTIKLFEIIDDKEEEFYVGLNQHSKNEAFFHKDTIGFQLNAGFLGGYNLEIQIIDKEFKSKLTSYDCTWQEDLKVEKQSLKLEKLNLVDKGKIRGQIYCEAKYNSKQMRDIIDKVKVEGYFEMDLVDLNNAQRLK